MTRSELRILIWLFVIALCAIFLSTAYAQCPGGVCSVGGPRFYPQPVARTSAASSPVGPGVLTWGPLYSDGNYYLYRDGKQIGGYRVETGEFLPILADGRWVEKWPPTSPPAAMVGEITNYGIDLSRLTPQRTYSLGGFSVATAAECFTGGPQLTDDSAKDFIVYVGSKVGGATFTAAWSGFHAEWKEKYHIQVYESGASMAKERGLTRDGVFVISRDGKSVTPTTVEGLLDTLNRIRNPPPRIPVPPIPPVPDPDAPKTNYLVWILGGALVLSLFRKK